MSRRSILTMTTAAGLLAAYALYAVIVTPMFRHSRPLSMRGLVYGHPGSETAPKESVEYAQKYLPNDPWAADAKYHYRTDSTVVYAEEWNHVDPKSGVHTPGSESDEPKGAVRFRPFAMIWFPQSGKPEEAITMTAGAAVVQFDSEFSLVDDDPNPVRVVGGILEGNVRITGPRGLAMSGRNFVFREDAMRVWSDNDVQFAYDGHTGSAHGLQIDLTPPQQPPQQNELAVGGIHSVRLRRNVKMNLSADQDGKPLNVAVESDGGFEYVIDSGIATFEDNVRVIRPTDTQTFDTLQCDLLTMVFSQPADHSLPTDNKGQNSFHGLGSSPEFRRLRAEGQAVILTSQENDLSARMNELRYDYENRVLVFEGGVQVRQGMSELRCPEMTLMHSEQGRITTAVCRGAGWLRHRDAETDNVTMEARWLKQLRKYPDPESDLDIIELQEQAWVRQPDKKSGLAAEIIKLWISGDPGSALERNGQPENAAERVRPKRLLALDQVAMVSPQLEGETKRLEIWFEELTPSETSSPQSTKKVTRDHLQPAIQRVAFDSGQTKAAATDPRQRWSSKEPIMLTADLVRVRAIFGQEAEEQRFDVAEVWTEGSVDISQRRNPQEEPFRLTGDRLHLRNEGENQQVLHVLGKPAKIEDRGVLIEGGEILLDRGKNETWIEGAGLLQLPVTRDFDGNELAEPGKLDIWWQEQMNFDGTAAVFYGDVQAILQDNQMRCQEMHVELSERVSFSNDAPDRGDVKLRRVTCRDGVKLDSYKYEGNKRVEVRKAEFWEFSLDQTTATSEAKGPGWIKFWSRGNGKRSAFTPNVIAHANQPVAPDTAEWDFTWIRFSDKATGNTRTRHMVFEDWVRIVYGPVKRPFESIDSEELPKEAGWMRCDSLQLTQQEKTETTPAYIQLLGSGNSELRGSGFHARSDTISYDESKKLYILRSLGERKATFWRQKSLGGDLSRADGTTIQFDPSRNWLKIDGTTGVQAAP